MEALTAQLGLERRSHAVEVQTLKARIHDLEEKVEVFQSQIRNLQLRHREDQNHAQVERTAQQVKVKELTSLLRSREGDLYSKECQMIQIQSQVEISQKQTTLIQKKYTQLQGKYSEITQYMHSQEGELKQHILLSQSLVQFAEEYVIPNEVMIEEKVILLQFNRELEVQIGELEATNECLLLRVQGYAQLRQELKLQNTQSNDLIGLSERFLQAIQAH